MSKSITSDCDLKKDSDSYQESVADDESIEHGPFKSFLLKLKSMHKSSSSAKRRSPLELLKAVELRNGLVQVEPKKPVTKDDLELLKSRTLENSFSRGKPLVNGLVFVDSDEESQTCTRSKTTGSLLNKLVYTEKGKETRKKSSVDGLKNGLIFE